VIPSHSLEERCDLSGHRHQKRYKNIAQLVSRDDKRQRRKKEDNEKAANKLNGDKEKRCRQSYH